MKSTITLIWIAFLVPFIADSQRHVSPGTMVRLQYGVKPFEMAGKIKSIHTTYRRRQKDSFDSPLLVYEKFQYNYDKLGLQTEYKIWDSKDKLLHHAYFNYNEANTQLTSINQIISRVQKSPQTFTQYTQVWESDSVCWHMDTTTNYIAKKYEYSAEGVIRRLTHYGKDTSIIKLIQEYDSRGNRISKEELVDDQLYKENWSYNYDKNGNILSKKGHYELYYTYDEMNRKISTKSISPYGEELTTFEYNSHGDIIFQKMTSYNPDRNYTSRRTYKYDSRDNWISKVVYMGDVDSEHKTRSIEYFD